MKQEPALTWTYSHAREVKLVTQVNQELQQTCEKIPQLLLEYAMGAAAAFAASASLSSREVGAADSDDVQP